VLGCLLYILFAGRTFMQAETRLVTRELPEPAGCTFMQAETCNPGLPEPAGCTFMRAETRLVTRGFRSRALSVLAKKKIDQKNFLFIN